MSKTYPLFVDETVKKLKTYLYFFTAVTEIEASKVVHLVAMEDKLAVAKSVYWSTQIIELLQKRIFELKAVPEEMICPSPQVTEFFQALLLADNKELLSGLLAVRTYLSKELIEHKGLTHTLWDEPTLEMIELVERYIGKQTKWLGDTVTFFDQEVRQEWLQRLEDAMSILKPTTFTAMLGFVAPNLEIPKRDKRFTVTTPNELKKPPEKELENRFTYHMVAFCIEIAAIEICSRLLVDYPEMPQQFRHDFARQLYDESCHTLSLLAFIEEDGGYMGEFPIHNNLWNYFMIGESLLEKLTIQQIVNEGHALDFNLFISVVHKMKHETFHSVLNDYVGADELNHVRYGVKWLSHLTGDEEKSMQVIDTVYNKLKTRNFRPSVKVQSKARRIAWMTDEQIDRAKQAVNQSLKELATLKVSKLRKEKSR